MTNTDEYRINKTQGQEHFLPCVKCTGKTTHKVLVSVNANGEIGDDEMPDMWHTDDEIIQCLGCKVVSFRNLSSDSRWDYCDENGNGGNGFETLYPSRFEGRKGFGPEKCYLPSNVSRIYNETLIALSSEAPVLAGIGLRALLEAVCKEKDATGQNLFNKIDSLVGASILTPAGALILHKIRTLGNAAAHEVKPHTEKQLSIAMDIIEHLLKDVYILPRQAESAFEEEI